MLGNVEAELHKYQHAAPYQKQNLPHQWELPKYGIKQQLAHKLDTLTLLTNK